VKREGTRSGFFACKGSCGNALGDRRPPLGPQPKTGSFFCQRQMRAPGPLLMEARKPSFCGV